MGNDSDRELGRRMLGGDEGAFDEFRGLFPQAVPLRRPRLRNQKEFVIKDTQRLQLMFNIFNLTDAETVSGVVQTTGRFFRQPRARSASNAACG
jgi:hypothetical protein